MTTLATLVAETKRHLNGTHREPLNKLNAAVSSGGSSLTFAYASQAIQQGALLQVGLEVMYVWSVDTTAMTATVERGWLGSTATAHSAGAVVTVNPRFADFAIVKAINDDLADLSAQGLYAVSTVELTATGTGRAYDLTGVTNLLEVVSVHARQREDVWSQVTNFDTARIAHADFASGLSFDPYDGVLSGQPIRVTYKRSFSPLVNLTDSVESVAGLPTHLQDLPPLGAAVALVAPQEISRNRLSSQGDSRRAEEVPPGAVGGSMRPLAARRQQRINNELSRLAQQYPERQAMPLPLDW